jgi:hypothetical protein
VDSGDKLDVSEGLDEPLLKVVGKRITWENKTGYTLQKELKDMNLQSNLGGSEDGDQNITSVEVYDNVMKENTQFFQAGQDVTITIYTAEPVTAAPVHNYTPQQNTTSSNGNHFGE